MWRFAEGFTGGDFETYFLLANPTGATVSATMSFFQDTGAVATKSIAYRRTAAPRSASATTPTWSTRPSPRPSPPARRSRPNGRCNWEASSRHATAGLTDQSTRWAFAEGLAGVFGGNLYETFYLFRNASASPITVTGSFYLEQQATARASSATSC